MGEREFDITVTDTADDEDYMISKAKYSEAHRNMRDKGRALEKVGNVQLAVAVLTDKEASRDEETKGEGVEDNGARPSKRQRLLPTTKEVHQQE